MLRRKLREIEVKRGSAVEVCHGGDDFDDEDVEGLELPSVSRPSSATAAFRDVFDRSDGPKGGGREEDGWLLYQRGNRKRKLYDRLRGSRSTRLVPLLQSFQVPSWVYAASLTMLIVGALVLVSFRNGGRDFGAGSGSSNGR